MIYTSQTKGNNKSDISIPNIPIRKEPISRSNNYGRLLRGAMFASILTLGAAGITGCAPSELGHQTTTENNITIPAKYVYTGFIKSITPTEAMSNANSNGYGQILMYTNNPGKYVEGGPGGGLKNSPSRSIEAKLDAKLGSKGHRPTEYTIFKGKETEAPKFMPGYKIVVNLKSGGTITVVEIRSYAANLTKGEEVTVATTKNARARIEPISSQ